jgi:hypothetical protein
MLVAAGFLCTYYLDFAGMIFMGWVTACFLLIALAYCMPAEHNQKKLY